MTMTETPTLDEAWTVLLDGTWESKSEARVAVMRVQEKMRELIGQRQTARDERNAALTRLMEFKAKVREAAIEHSQEESHCVDGLNDWLDGLGLEKVVVKWRVQGNIEWEAYAFDMVVEAADEDEAKEKAMEELGDRYSDDYAEAVIDRLADTDVTEEDFE